MLTDPKFVPCNLEDLSYDSELNFRMVSTVEAETGAWRKLRRAEHLFKPVALNPLLYRNEAPLISELKQGVGHVFAACVPAAYSPHHSYRDMYLTDPPCKTCRMDLMYKEKRPAVNGYIHRGCMA
jgi:hypothetical protein